MAETSDETPVVDEEYRALSPEEQAIVSTFHAHLGKSMAAWASVEGLLCGWFAKLSGMPYPVAKQVFFSTEGGFGKWKMLRGVLSVVTPVPDTRVFLKCLLTKFNQYNETRNLLAHGRVVFINIPQSPHNKTAILVRGRDMPGNPDLSDLDVLTEDNVISAAWNFGLLAWYLNKGLNWDGKDPERHPDRFLRQLEQLPTSAHPSRATPTAS